MGKFEIVKEEDGEYSFYLLANNGQILYSSRFYASEVACRKGVDSFKRAAYVGNFFVDRDKFGNYRYVLKTSARRRASSANPTTISRSVKRSLTR